MPHAVVSVIKKSDARDRASVYSAFFKAEALYSEEASAESDKHLHNEGKAKLFSLVE